MRALCILLGVLVAASWATVLTTGLVAYVTAQPDLAVVAAVEAVVAGVSTAVWVVMLVVARRALRRARR